MSWLDRFLAGSALNDAARAAARGDPERVRAVESVLAELRPMFVADGGEIELIAIEDDWVVVKLRGACRTCCASDLSLQGAVEPRLKEHCVWVRGVRAG